MQDDNPSSFLMLLHNLYTIHAAQAECAAYGRKIAEDLRDDLGRVDPLYDYLNGYLEEEDLIALHELGVYIVRMHHQVHELLVENMALGLEYYEHLTTALVMRPSLAASVVDDLIAAAAEVSYEDDAHRVYCSIRHHKFEH